MKAILYDWGGLNIWLFHAINDLRGPFIDRFMTLGTRLADHHNLPLYLALLVLAAAVAGWRDAGRTGTLRRRWLPVILVFVLANLAGAVTVYGMKAGFGFPRPAAALPAGSMHLVGAPTSEPSFPSGHSAFAMIVAASLWPLLARGGRWVAAAYVAWGGLSRISLGYHFPADVLAGFAIAFLIVFVIRRLVTRFLPDAGGRSAAA